MSNIEKIRQEIKRRKIICEGVFERESDTYYQGKAVAYGELLAFIDSLPEGIPPYQTGFKGHPDPAGVKIGDKIVPSIDAGIDLYFYGRKFLHYDRKEIGDVRVDMGDGKPWVPVNDWMKEGKDMTPDQLRAFAKYFYDRGRESYRVTIKGEELIIGTTKKKHQK